MEQFIVSARKYRPSTFNSVVGQLSITTTLKNAIRSNQLAQAFLFTGPRGVGKTTCARILAKTINCTNLTSDIECCNQCESCVAFNNGQSLNIFELDAASNSSVDDMRALVEQVRYHPQGGKYRTYIIDEVHMLTTQAFNAFLKTLEEPPAYAKFILATTEKHKIIPTILSRCQIFDFNRITVNDIADHLAWVAKSEQVTAEPEALHLIAQKADGALRDALSIFDQLVSFAGSHITYKDVAENLNVLDHEYYFRFTEQILNKDTASSLLLLDEIVKDGFNLQHFVNGLACHFRDLMVCKDAQTASLLEATPAVKEKYLIQSAKIEVSQIFTFLEILSKCDYQFPTAQNQRLHVEIALIKMCELFGQERLAESSKSVGTAPSVTAPPVAVSIPSNPTTIPPIPSTVSSSPKPIIQPNPKADANTLDSKSPVTKADHHAEQKTPDVKQTSISASAPANTKPTVRSGATISISQTLSSGPNLAAGQNEAKDPFMKYEGVKLDEEPVSAALKKLSERMMKAGRKQISLSLISYPFQIVENNIIEIPVENSVQYDEIRSSRVEILDILRNEDGLKCGDVRCKILPMESVRKAAYSPLEKFNQMSEKNPLIKSLKQRLNLDLDF
ncbi:MAG: DNA polymerase III subunit gamma/tau [Bacteroidota bacterium]